MKRTRNAPEILEAYERIVPVWNDPAYSRVALEKRLETRFGKLEARVGTIRDALESEEELIVLGLEPPVFRDRRSGDIILTNEEERRRMREFAIDPGVFRDAKGIVVTAAQFNGVLQRPAYEALERYAAYRGFLLVVMPIKYGPIRVDAEGNIIGAFPEELRGKMIMDSVNPIPDLCLNPLRMRPTLSTFLTDMVAAVGDEVSQVFGAPVFELRHLPRIGRCAGDRYPKAVMTTGAVTQPNYRRDNLGQQDRTAELAEEAHSYGAVVAEFSSDRKLFQFRQLICGKRGRFYDICHEGILAVSSSQVRKLKPGKAVSAVFLGDEHVGQTDRAVEKATFGRDGLVPTLRPKTLVVSDYFDGHSVNPFDRETKKGNGHLPMRFLKRKKSWDSLENEAKQGAKILLDRLDRFPFMEIYMVPANHHEFLDRYVLDGAWLQDPTNAEVGAKLFLAWIDAVKKATKRNKIPFFDPLEHLLRCQMGRLIARKKFPKNLLDRVRFFHRQEAVLLPRDVAPKKRILIMHGDVGPTGPTRSIKVFRKYGKRVLLGHNHSATIQGGIWRVGVSTPRVLPYHNGPATNWTNTHAVIFENGQRMLVNIIHGDWCVRR